MSENMTQLPPYDELVRRPELWPCVKAMVERLQATVDRLPKTKDGVAVAKGTRLWTVAYGRVLEDNGEGARWYGKHYMDQAACFARFGYRNSLGVWIDVWGEVGDCFSTRAAAEAARETKC